MKRAPRKRESGSLLEPQFQDQHKARECLEGNPLAGRPDLPALWLVIGGAYRIVRKEKIKEQIIEMLRARKRIRKAQKGLWKCKGCKKQFTVTVGTIFEDSHIPLHKRLLAIHLLTSRKRYESHN